MEIKRVVGADHELRGTELRDQMIKHRRIKNTDAVWFYPEPKEAAAEIKGRVAFWKGVTVR